MQSSLQTRARALRRAAALAASIGRALAMFEIHRRLEPHAREAVLDNRVRVWARHALEVLNVHEDVHWAVPLPWTERARLIIANHRSTLDIPILLSKFGGAVLSRADVEQWPLVGRAAKRAGTLFVNRQNSASGVSAVRAIRRRLLTGASVILFPEGGTFTGDEVRPFKTGAFGALRSKDVDIVPVGLAHEPDAEFFGEPFMTHATRLAERPCTHVSVSIGTPFSAASSAASLAERAHREVQELVHDARRRL